MKDIEDYGDKIGGARKDLFAQWINRLVDIAGADPEMFRSASLAGSFPKPDYEALAGAGASPDALASICAARGAIGRKPSNKATVSSVRTWIALVNAGLLVSRRVLSDEDPDPDALGRIMEKYGSQVNATWQAMRLLPPSALSSAEGSFVAERSGKLYVVSSLTRRALAETQDPGEPGRARAAADMMIRIAEAETRKKASVTRTLEERLAAKICLMRSHDGDLFLGVSGKNGHINLSGTVADRKAARSWLEANREAAIARLVALSGDLEARPDRGLPRTGPEVRTGDVGPAELCERFGLRAIEFGNYVEKSRRPADLNATCESLADLARTLGVPERMTGFDGGLAVAFGARGGGRWAAHYEPLRRVINLTKTAGAGCLAHEWFHALDNAVTMSSPAKAESRSAGWASERDAALQAAMSGYAARMRGLDALKSAPYYSQVKEMAARSFETWLDRKMTSEGETSPHLIGLADTEAYPTPEEMALIAPQIERFVRSSCDAVLDDMGMGREAPEGDREDPAAEKDAPAQGGRGLQLGFDFDL